MKIQDLRKQRKDFLIKFLEEKPSRSTRGYKELAKRFRLTEEEVSEIAAPYRKSYRDQSFSPVRQEVEVRKHNEERIIGDKSGKFNIPGLHVILPCVHIPHQDKRLENIAMQIVNYLGKSVKGFHIIGDFLDMEALSSHSKGDVSNTLLSEEYDLGNSSLDLWDKALPKDVLKTYIYGNHEDRYFRYMRNVDNSKLGSALQSPTSALSLHQRNYFVYEDWKKSVVTLGHHLDLFHGEFTNDYAASKHLNTYRRSCIFGHTHRVQVYTKGHYAAYNIGFMGNKNSPAFGYATRAMLDSWGNAFAIVYIDSEGYFHTEVLNMFNNMVLYGGKIFR
jgi:predicted phosphodiesterase